MKKINVLLCLACSAFLLASCSPSENPDQSSSLEIQTDWTNDDKATFEEVLGEGNLIPFYQELVSLNYEAPYVESSCNYVIVQADSVNKEEKFNAYADICLEDGFIETDKTNDSFQYYKFFEKVLLTDETKETTQYIQYYDDDLYLVIESYVITTYYSDTFPTNPSIQTLLDSEADVPAIEGISDVEYYQYTSDYCYHVNLKGNVETFSYDQVLIDAGYEVDTFLTTAYTTCYYKVVSEYEAHEIYVPKVVTNEVEIIYTVAY